MGFADTMTTPSAPLAAALWTAAVLWWLGPNSPAGAAEPVRMTLIPGVEAATPGEPFPVILRQDITPGWHSYWLNPGDSGLATGARWTLPPGAEAGPLNFPVPGVFSTAGVVSYGYASKVDLLVALTPPKGNPPGGRFAAEVRVEWLACKDICIPGQADLKLDLPLRSEPGAPPKPVVAEARRRLPEPQSGPIHFIRDGKTLVIALTRADLKEAQLREAYFYPSEWGIMDHGAKQAADLSKDGTLRLRVARDANFKGELSRLTGVLTLATDRGRRAFAIEALPAPSPSR